MALDLVLNMQASEFSSPPPLKKLHLHFHCRTCCLFRVIFTSSLSLLDGPSRWTNESIVRCSERRPLLPLPPTPSSRASTKIYIPVALDKLIIETLGKWTRRNRRESSVNLRRAHDPNVYNLSTWLIADRTKHVSPYFKHVSTIIGVYHAELRFSQLRFFLDRGSSGTLTDPDRGTRNSKDRHCSKQTSESFKFSSDDDLFLQRVLPVAYL